MTKRCGNCRWWDRNNKITVKQVRTTWRFAKCLIKDKEPAMRDIEGQDCTVYEERKG